MNIQVAAQAASGLARAVCQLWSVSSLSPKQQHRNTKAAWQVFFLINAQLYERVNLYEGGPAKLIR